VDTSTPLTRVQRWGQRQIGFIQRHLPAHHHHKTLRRHNTQSYSIELRKDCPAIAASSTTPQPTLAYTESDLQWSLRTTTSVAKCGTSYEKILSECAYEFSIPSYLQAAKSPSAEASWKVAASESLRRNWLMNSAPISQILTSPKSISSCWGYSLTNTFKFKKKIISTDDLNWIGAIFFCDA